MLGKKGVTYSFTVTVIFLAILFYGVFKIANDTNIDPTLKEKLINGSMSNKVAATFLLKSLDDMTPTLSYKLPFTDSKIYLINEFPVFAWTHTVVILILIAISGIIMHFAKASRGVMIGIFLLMIILGYVIGSIILYFTYYTTASSVGLTQAEATELRREYSANYDNFAAPLIIVSLIALLSISKAIFKKVKK